MKSNFNKRYTHTVPLLIMIIVKKNITKCLVTKKKKHNIIMTSKLIAILLVHRSQ